MNMKLNIIINNQPPAEEAKDKTNGIFAKQIAKIKTNVAVPNQRRKNNKSKQYYFLPIKK